MHDSLYFSDHHLQVREMVRDFANNVVKPTARQYDLDSRFPWDNVKQMAELGLFGIPNSPSSAICLTLSQGKRLSRSYWRAVGFTTLLAKSRTISRTWR